jgi:hypothetical protein
LSKSGSETSGNGQETGDSIRPSYGFYAYAPRWCSGYRLHILNAELEGAGRDHTFFKKWKNATANYYIFLQEGELPTSTPFFVGIDFTKGISQKRARYFSNQYADYPQGGAYFLEKDSFEETVRRWLLKASLERITLIELHLNNGQIVSSSNKSFEDIQSLMNAILVEPFGAPSTK